MAGNRVSSVSKADSLEKMGEFWDSHDLTDFDTGGPDAEFAITCVVPVELDLYTQLEEQARMRGVRVETLANLWLQQKLAEQGRMKTAEPERSGG